MELNKLQGKVLELENEIFDLKQEIKSLTLEIKELRQINGRLRAQHMRIG